MSLNQALNRYKEASSKKAQNAKEKEREKEKLATSKASTSASTSNTKAASSSATTSSQKTQKAAAAPTGATIKNGKASAQNIKTAVATASVDAAAAEANENEEARKAEEALQAELEKEIAKEAAHTSKLVKDDLSPVNANRDQLIVEYAPLIKYIAQKIAARLPANIELDDLISSGVIGLMDSIDKYDASRDNKFKTYAEFRIRGAILDELRAQDWVPRSVREKAKQLERCYSKLEQKTGRHATDEEVCEELGISQDEFHDLLNQVRSVSLISYDDISNFSKTDKRLIHGYGENSKSATPFSEVNHAVFKKMISDSIGELPEKQRLVLSLYYYEDLNLKEIGRVLDVTESRVSQLHTQAIIKLKSKLRKHLDELASSIG